MTGRMSSKTCYAKLNFDSPYVGRFRYVATHITKKYIKKTVCGCVYQQAMIMKQYIVEQI